MKHLGIAIIASLALTVPLSKPSAQTVSTLESVRPPGCDIKERDVCWERNAIVFVHGIYGSQDTFRNETTGFDWPAEFPTEIDVQPVDVYRLNYRTALLSWAKGANPDFVEVTKSVATALKPLRMSGYRSIGFVAHSLGGNMISTYIHEVKTAAGHPQRSQNAFVITLGTPVLGSQIADIASRLKSILGMKDPLLEALKKDNFYLRMLQHFRALEGDKGGRYECRPVHLHAAVEDKYLGVLLVVRPESAAAPISQFVKSPIVGFPLDHQQIARPRNSDSGVYSWALHLITQEYERVASWDYGNDATAVPPDRRLCHRVDFIPEN
jgi:hypothetical protein